MIVVSSHLYWDPKYDYVKYGQTNYLMKRLGDFKFKTIQHYKTEPAVIICGDFNSQPHASSVSLIYNSNKFAKNNYYQRNPAKFDAWYNHIWS